jgi:DNA-binding transcriptional ArsR family regulator
MNKKNEQDYLSKHKQIRDKMIGLTKENERACVDVAQLASRLGMDKRTVRSHLKIMEVDAVGVFMDPDEKQFCTKAGIALLANILNQNERLSEPDNGQK